MKKVTKTTAVSLSLLTSILFTISCTPNPATNTGVNVSTGQSGTGIIKGKVSTEGFKTTSFSLKANPELSLGTVKASSQIDTKEVKISADGSFEIEVKGGADYKLEAIVPDGLGGTLKVVNPLVKVPLSKDPPIVDVKSLVTKQTGSIQGLIIIEDAKEGESLEGADVYIPGTSIVGKARDKGRFALTEVAEGTWDIIISKPGFERALVKGVEVKAGKARLVDDVVLKRNSNESKSGLKGTIQDGNGSAIVGATITAYAKNTVDSFTAISDENGAFNLLNLPTGDYQIQVYRAFYELPARKDVTISDKTEDLGITKLTSTLVFFGKVKGKIVDEEGKAIDGAVIQTLPQVTDQQFSDAVGNFTLDRVLPGEYSASISAGGYCTVEMSLRVENKENYLLNLENSIILPKKNGADDCSQIVSAGNLPILPKSETGNIESALLPLARNNPDVLNTSKKKLNLLPDNKIEIKSDIVYSATDYSSGTGISDIYLYSSILGQKNITNNPDQDSNPLWSSKGDKISWLSKGVSVESATQLYIMSDDGSNKESITVGNNRISGNASWSPDDNKFVLGLNNESTGSLIYTMDINGSNRALAAPLLSIFPDWSKAVNKIAFTYGKTGPQDENITGIAVIKPDGSNRTDLTSNTTDFFPNWSPDGSKIAFTRFISGNFDLYVIDANGSNLRQLTNTTNEQETKPQWSPDSSKIIFQSIPKTGRTSDYAGINIINNDGSNRSVLLRNTNTKVYSSPDWRKTP